MDYHFVDDTSIFSVIRDSTIHQFFNENCPDYRNGHTHFSTAKKILLTIVRLNFS